MPQPSGRRRERLFWRHSLCWHCQCRASPTAWRHKRPRCSLFLRKTFVANQVIFTATSRQASLNCASCTRKTTSLRASSSTRRQRGFDWEFASKPPGRITKKNLGAVTDGAQPIFRRPIGRPSDRNYNALVSRLPVTGARTIASARGCSLERSTLAASCRS